MELLENTSLKYLSNIDIEDVLKHCSNKMFCLGWFKSLQAAKEIGVKAFNSLQDGSYVEPISSLKGTYESGVVKALQKANYDNSPTKQALRMARHSLRTPQYTNRLTTTKS